MTKAQVMHPLGRKISRILLLKVCLIAALIYYIRPYKMKPTETQMVKRLLHAQKQETLTNVQEGSLWMS